MERKKQVSHSDRFTKFRLWREFCHLEQKEESLRLGEFNENVFWNIKSDNWNLRKHINFTTPFLVEKKRTKTYADIAKSEIFRKSVHEKQTIWQSYKRLTPAYVHWLADVHFAVFAPAFPLVALRQEIRTQTANAHSLGR